MHWNDRNQRNTFENFFVKTCHLIWRQITVLIWRFNMPPTTKSPCSPSHSGKVYTTLDKTSSVPWANKTWSIRNHLSEKLLLLTTFMHWVLKKCIEKPFCIPVVTSGWHLLASANTSLFHGRRSTFCRLIPKLCVFLGWGCLGRLLYTLLSTNFGFLNCMHERGAWPLAKRLTIFIVVVAQAGV